jgi:hypothetical protein
VNTVQLTRSSDHRSLRRVGPLAVVVVLAGLVATALSGCTSTLGYAARVNGSVISQKTINQELADISGNSKYVDLIDQPGNSGPVVGSSPGTYSKSFVAIVLDQEIQFEVIRQRLAASNALPTPAQVASARSAVSQGQFPTGVYEGFSPRYQDLLAYRQAEVDRFVGVVTTDLVGDALTQYYQSHQADYATEACVSHILIADKDAAGQIDFAATLADALKVKALLNGGGDFAALAKQYSQDNQGTTGGSAAQGGVLTGTATDGCLSTQDLQQLVTPFAQSVVSLPVNQVSDPVMTTFGYHLIKVTSRVIEPLDDTVTANIHRREAGQRLNKLVADAHVKLNPEFGSYDGKATATGEVKGVIPPLVPSLAPESTTSTIPPDSTAGSTGSTGSSTGG